MRKRYLIFSLLVILSFIFFNCSHNSQSQLYNQKVTVQDASRAGEVLKDSLYNIEMVYIPAGTIKFDEDYERHETLVFLKSFYIGKYEVTQSQWKVVMGNNPSEVKGDNLPVTNIHWYDVEEFIKKLSEKTGQSYRLPTESEWEYACRAGTATDYHFGNDTLLIGEYEWWKRNSDEKLHPVGLKKPNPWGLYDIGGNACEWTATLWDPAPWLKRNPDRKPFDDNLRIVRSSSSLHGRTAHFRSDYCHAYQEKRPRNYTGFRVVRDE